MIINYLIKRKMNNLKIIRGLSRSLNNSFYVQLNPINCNKTLIIYTNYKKFEQPKRNFSLQSNIESIAKTQVGIFKTLSESAPVEYFQKFLLTLHDYSGLPWWATIVTTTIFLRTSVTLPLGLYQRYILAKIENIKAEMPDIAKELKLETAVAVKMFNWDERTAKINFQRSLKKQWNNLIVRDNCHPAKASLLLWFQIPIWITFSVSLRNLVYMLPNQDLSAQLTLTELCLGGFGWIPNLTLADSTFILPITFGLLNLTIIELQTLSKVTVPTKFQRYLMNFMRGFSVFMIPVATSVPSCLVLYWTTSSACGLIQNLVILSPKVRRFCGIPLAASELDRPYYHILIGFKHRFKDILPFLKT